MNYFGIYRGICTSTNDPEKMLRIRAQVPQILGTAETDWALPCVPPGWSDDLLANHTFTDNDSTGGNSTETLTHALRQKTPKPGEGVWIMFEAGDLTKPVWVGVWKKR